MYFWKLVGFRKFTRNNEDGTSQDRYQVCFEDPKVVADVGVIYKTYSFPAYQCPELKKDHIGKEVIVDIGNYNGVTYGKEIVFR